MFMKDSFMRTTFIYNLRALMMLVLSIMWCHIPAPAPLHHIDAPSLVTYCSNISPYNTSERTCIISRMIRASGPWAEGKNIPDYDGWAGRDIIPDGGGWAHVGNMYSRWVGPDVYYIRRVGRGRQYIILDRWAEGVI